MSLPDFTRLRDSPPEERLATYRELWKAGEQQYGPSDLVSVQRGQGNIYMKRVPFALQEATAMNIVKEYTNIPVPIILDVVDDFIVMTRLPGQPIGQVFYGMDEQEVATVQDSLAGIVGQLRSIPSTVEGAVSGPLHEMPCCDVNRVNIESGLPTFGPFDSTAAFHDFLLSRIPPSAAARLLPKYQTVHADKQRVYFTHGDLNLTNILVENG